MGVSKIIAYIILLLMVFIPVIYLMFPGSLSHFLDTIINSFVVVLIPLFIVFVKVVDKISKKMKESRQKRRKEKLKEWKINTIDNFYE